MDVNPATTPSPRAGGVELIEGDWFCPLLRSRVNAAARERVGRAPFDTSLERHPEAHGGAG
ncbi:MAG: hypothetical protein ACRDRN_03555 [Sciscionella sp.]